MKEKEAPVQLIRARWSLRRKGSYDLEETSFSSRSSVVPGTERDSTLSQVEHKRIAHIHRVWAWLCGVYALILCVIGVMIPLSMGRELALSNSAFDTFLIYFLYLFGMADICIGLKYRAAREFKHFLAEFFGFWKTLALDIYECAIVIINLIRKKELETPSPEIKASNSTEIQEKPLGRLGIRIGLKVFGIILMINTLVELSIFADLDNEDELCHPGLKVGVVVLQLLFIIGQTHFLLNNHKVKLHYYPFLASFSLAHLIGTTFCLGVMLVTYDFLHKILSLYQLPEDASKETIVQLLRLDTETLANFTANTCHLKVYLEEETQQLGSYTYIFCLFYVYSSLIVLFFLFIHYRDFSVRGSEEGILGLVRRLRSGKPMESSFSAAASLSLIVGAVVVSILSVGGQDNIYIQIYLLIVHSQANLVAFMVLVKIGDLPLDSKRNVKGDMVVIFVSLFGLVLYNFFKHITAGFDGDSEEVDTMEMVTSVVETCQVILQTILMLIGLQIRVPKDMEQKMTFQPPTELLIHLTAGNLSALIAGIFTSKMELFAVKNYIAEEGLLNVGLAWGLLGSVLIPWQSFYRFYSIIVLVEIRKIILENFEIK